MTDTIPVPVTLLTELAKAASASERSALASQAFDLLPKSAPRLVLVNLDSPEALSMQAMWAVVNPFEGCGLGSDVAALLARINQSPDVMALIEQVVQVHDRAHPMADPIAESGVLDRIRTALEGATS